MISVPPVVEPARNTIPQPSPITAPPAKAARILFSVTGEKNAHASVVTPETIIAATVVNKKRHPHLTIAIIRSGRFISIVRLPTPKGMK